MGARIRRGMQRGAEKLPEHFEVPIRIIRADVRMSRGIRRLLDRKDRISVHDIKNITALEGGCQGPRIGYARTLRTQSVGL